MIVKVPPTSTYIDTYRALLPKGREVLGGVVGVKRTRLGHILLEVDKKSSVSALAASVGESLRGSGIECSPLQDRTSIEVRDIDPMVEGPEVLADLAAAVNLTPSDLWLKMLRMGPMGTQSAVVELPTNGVNVALTGFRFRTGLTLVRCRVLPSVARCFLCHQMGHMARNCPVVGDGAELCRRCGQGGT